NRSWRKVKVTDRRANEDFAVCMRDLVDLDYPGANRVRVVMDNLSTHTASAVYQTFPAAEARRILRRLEFHYTPRHASWLNMAEIEIGVMRRQCLDRRIDNRDLLKSEVDAWERRRTESGAQIRWMFSTDQAREKMAKSYPIPLLNES
ncbi:transposase, partial [Neorhizobium petrolearium]|uniref:transposase n=1 Tax=Neorhizobium petrolearium TaxID=515361 RepID=UPI001AE60568